MHPATLPPHESVPPSNETLNTPFCFLDPLQLSSPTRHTFTNRTYTSHSCSPDNLLLPPSKRSTLHYSSFSVRSTFPLPQDIHIQTGHTRATLPPPKSVPPGPPTHKTLHTLSFNFRYPFHLHPFHSPTRHTYTNNTYRRHSSSPKICSSRSCLSQNAPHSTIQLPRFVPPLLSHKTYIHNPCLDTSPRPPSSSTPEHTNHIWDPRPPHGCLHC